MDAQFQPLLLFFLILMLAAARLRMQEREDEEIDEEYRASSSRIAARRGSMSVGWDAFSEGFLTFTRLLQERFLQGQADSDDIEDSLQQLSMLCFTVVEGLRARRVREWYVLPRQKAWWDQFVKTDWDDHRWRKNFRVTRENFSCWWIFSDQGSKVRAAMPRSRCRWS